MREILRGLLHLEQGEQKLVLLSLLQSFFIGASQVFTGTTANTLFLINFEAKLLPLVYIASALTVPVIGILLIRLEKRLSHKLVSIMILLLLTGVPLLLLSLFYVSPGLRILTFILLVWVDAEIILSGLVFWTTANRLYNIRQAKRLFGLIGSGQVIAYIAAGALIPLLVRHIEIPLLLTVSVGGHVFSLLILLNLHRLFDDRKKNISSIDESSRIPLSGFIKENYLRNIFLMVGLGYLVYYFVDLSFYDLSQSLLTPGQELASFLGVFWSAVGIGNLFMRTVVYGRWTTATGIRGGLLAGPALIGLGAVSAILLSAFNPSLSSIFIVIIITKFLERVFINSMYVPAYFTLFQPFEDNIRDRLQNFTETVIGQGAGGIAGLFLLLIFVYMVLPPVIVYLLLFFIIFIWIFSILRISGGYRKSLAEALRTMGLKGREITLSKNDINYLKDELKSDNPLRVKACLTILGNNNCTLNTGDKILLLNNSSPLVQAEVCSMLIQEQDPVLLPELLKHFNQRKNTGMIPGLMEAIGATKEEEAFRLLTGLLNSSNTGLRDEAILSLLRYFPENEDVVPLKEMLHEWTVSEAVEKRFSAAFIIPGLTDKEFIRDTSLLLNDKESEIQKLTVNSLSPDMVPVHLGTLIKVMNRPGLETSSVQALSGTDKEITGKLEAVYNDLDENDIFKKACITRIYKNQARESNKYLLCAKLEEEDIALRADLLYALQSCGYKAQHYDIGMLQGLLESEREYCFKIFSAIKVLIRESDNLLADGLRHEVEKSVERIFIILSFIYFSEEIIVALNNLNSRSAEKRAFALELADTLISKKYKPLVFPIIEDFSIDRKIKLLEKNYRNLRLPDRSELLGSINQGHWKNSWLETCVRYLNRDSRAQNLVKTVKILRKAELFSEIPDEKLAGLAPITEEFNYSEGRRIITKGETGTSMYIIAAGRVKVHDGDTVLAEIGRGSFFGELAALSPEPRSASITGITATQLFNIEQKALIEFMKSNLDAGRAVISVLCLRIRDALKKKECLMPGCQAESAGNTITTDLNDEPGLLKKFLSLKSQPVFHKLPVTILTEVAEREKRLKVKKGHTLFIKSERSSRLYLVIEGRFNVESNNKLVQTVGKNQILGELSALDSRKREASARASCDSVVLEINQRTLTDLMWNQYDLIEGFLQILIFRLRQINRIER
ncbi:MAG: cyclic nucleotide-binding domain-containing protein [Spirochaetes bacterium]|nr:cyclic nucleotide-binding domain-containing protein [Spirochaetota bacterium]